MRLWSLHPAYLDQKGICGLWVESLLAQKVLKGETKGYKNHPQLNRFKNKKYPIKSICNYLYFIWEEADRRGYKFDNSKICLEHDDWVVDCPDDEMFINVTKGQLVYEFNHLREKLRKRDYNKAYLNEMDIECELENIKVNPIFKIVDGEIESWEKV